MEKLRAAFLDQMRKSESAILIERLPHDEVFSLELAVRPIAESGSLDYVIRTQTKKGSMVDPIEESFGSDSEAALIRYQDLLCEFGPPVGILIY